MKIVRSRHKPAGKDKQMKKEITEKEIIEMVSILLELSPDSYSKCKNTILEMEKEPNTLKFFQCMFDLVDKQRNDGIHANGCALCGCQASD